MTRAYSYNFSDTSSIQVNLQGQNRVKETAQYIADMLLELRHLAKSNGFATLQGLLEISYYEAFNEAHRLSVPAGEAERLYELGADARKAAVG